MPEKKSGKGNKVDIDPKLRINPMHSSIVVKIKYLTSNCGEMLSQWAKVRFTPAVAGQTCSFGCCFFSSTSQASPDAMGFVLGWPLLAAMWQCA